MGLFSRVGLISGDYGSIFLFPLQCSTPPSLLKYMSYMFNFQSALSGPSCTYKQYLRFMDGSDTRQSQITDGKEPSSSPFPFLPILSKLTYSIMCFAVFLTVGKYYSYDATIGEYICCTVSRRQDFYRKYNSMPWFSWYTFTHTHTRTHTHTQLFAYPDPKYMSTLPSVLLTSFMVGLLIRFRYYFFWHLTDSIHNASGMGFSG